MQLSCVTKSKKWRKEMGTMLNEEKKWYEKAGKESDVSSARVCVWRETLQICRFQTA